MSDYELEFEGAEVRKSVDTDRFKKTVGRLIEENREQLDKLAGEHDE